MRNLSCGKKFLLWGSHTRELKILINVLYHVPMFPFINYDILNLIFKHKKDHGFFSNLLPFQMGKLAGEEQ